MKRCKLIVWGVLLVLVFGAGLWFLNKEDNSSKSGGEWDDKDLEAFLQMEGTDSITSGLMTHIDNYRMIGEDFLPYMVDDMCGYHPQDNNIGVLTVRRNIPEDVYNAVLPSVKSQKDTVVAAGDLYLYIKPMSHFPDGDCGRINCILANDSVIQVQFTRSSMEEAVAEMQSRIDNVSDLLDKLTVQMDSIKNNR